MTVIKRGVVYGYPWFTSFLRHAVEINVVEPDVAVNNHIPIELLKEKKWQTPEEIFSGVLEEERHLSIKESFKQFWRDRALNRMGYWRQHGRRR
jgi:hypothetical protein